ncbi:MAG: FIG00031715: Predicted metal-dependent phosphoesterases (PHP family) [uncultured Thermomicrobiales bacterium]|uniref:FIG00031715: Predicted metal-dependent phosphoesterases (PHP family) n=1 Tax=uncultured Thermomicrobiales bacterium TaxID=1645740 RepID=A0A6J4U0U1_9BACT|nr:MAG: FIG00031715: Predicted metal-dependent phosphoesterases (PHP family) [uncultured Thermomicrobiales bacterium]
MIPRAPTSGGPNPVDLHAHTTVSDGMLAPAALVQEAARRGLRVLGITDHDTVGGLDEAETEAGRLGLTLVPGIELGSDGGGTGHEIHVLGYFVERRDPGFLDALDGLAARRRERVDRIIQRLAEVGAPVAAERVAEISGTGSVGRPHVARAMVEAGHVPDLPAAFDRFLASGRPAYVPRHPFSPEDAVRLVRDAGGVPVLAHPLTTGDVEATVDRLVKVGLKGMEVYYGAYPPETQTALRAIADEKGLVPSGGSDFHGWAGKTGRDLGGPAVPEDTADLLFAARG